MLFWWSVFYRSNPGVAAWHLFVTMMHTGILGALMTLAPKVLYQAQTATAAEWGLTPLQDQQLAGLIMWVPAGTVYAGAAMVLTMIWIRESGEAQRGDAIGAH
jgi:cytochrome c oxidase assembly factor CtaG